MGALLGGLMSDALGWRSLFAFTALAGLVLPMAVMILPRIEETVQEPLDIPGGVILGVVLGGLLLAVTEGGQAGWGAPLVLGAAGISLGALVLGVLRQRTASAPFIPRELLRERRYSGLVGMSFTAGAVNLDRLSRCPWS